MAAKRGDKDSSKRRNAEAGTAAVGGSPTKPARARRRHTATDLVVVGTHGGSDQLTAADRNVIDFLAKSSVLSFMTPKKGGS